MHFGVSKETDYTSSVSTVGVASPNTLEYSIIKTRQVCQIMPGNIIMAWRKEPIGRDELENHFAKTGINMKLLQPLERTLSLNASICSNF